MSPPPTAAALLRHPWHTSRLSSGCANIDECLDGGIDRHGITEIAGEAGAGKTQLALQLLLQVQLPDKLGGLGGGAIYLHSDAPSAHPAMQRLRSLAECFERRHGGHGATTALLMSHVHVVQVDSIAELESLLRDVVPEQLRSHSIRLLVLDSIAALCRTHGDDGTSSRASVTGERAGVLFKLAATLKALSDKYNVAVVVTNQVSDKPIDAHDREAAAPWELGACALPDGGGCRVPSLGMAWGHCVNTRLVLTRREVAAAQPSAAVPRTPCTVADVATEGTRPLGEGLDNGQRRDSDAAWQEHAWQEHACAAPPTHWSRRLHVAWSPRLPARSIAYAVREEGVVAPARFSDLAS